jgi:hypothetical protein
VVVGFFLAFQITQFLALEYHPVSIYYQLLMCLPEVFSAIRA